ncbi:hypothetical protein EBS80_02490 [bacterium]|nr:hypothetical protein [bacterium]
MVITGREGGTRTAPRMLLPEGLPGTVVQLADRGEPSGRTDIAHHPQVVETVSRRHGLFKGYETANGSIGISMARLWKGEDGAAVLHGDKNTPWDWAPVYGISRKLGFRFFSIIDEGEFAGFLPFDPPIPKVIQPVEHPLFVVHESRLDELEAWIAKTYGSGVTLRR